MATTTAKAKAIPTVRAVIVVEGLPTADKNSLTVTIEASDTRAAGLISQALASYAVALKRLYKPPRTVALRPWWER